MKHYFFIEETIAVSTMVIPVHHCYGSAVPSVQWRHGNYAIRKFLSQVLALNVLLTSDGEALRRLADEGRLNKWAEASIGWAKQTFGEDNVVGAHLHMDEQTPHLYATVVSIVTTERKKKASEAKATKRYRTKSKDGA